MPTDPGSRYEEHPIQRFSDLDDVLISGDDDPVSRQRPVLDDDVLGARPIKAKDNFVRGAHRPISGVEDFVSASHRPISAYEVVEQEVEDEGEGKRNKL